MSIPSNVEIASRLHALIGEPLTDMYRFGRIQVFELGVQRPSTNRKGEAITFADQRLHISSQWSIFGPDDVVLTSGDFGPGQTRDDEIAQPFYDLLVTDPLIVETIVVGEDGSLALQMSRGYRLLVDAVSQPDEDDDNGIEDANTEDVPDEFWRYLPDNETAHQLVVTSEGIRK